MDDPHIALMLKFQRGDEAAFRELFEIYKVPLLHFIYRFCQDRRVSEELSQEVFLRIYRTAAAYRPDAKFSTWIYRIATNICLNEVRTGKYRFELVSCKAHKRGTGEVESSGAGVQAGCDEQIIADENQQAIRQAIASLPDKQRMALILSIYEELSYREIAERLRCSEGAVKSIIHRAKISIRDFLKRECKQIT